MSSSGREMLIKDNNIDHEDREFAALVKLRRRALKITQEDLANAGVANSRTTICNIEKCKQRATLSQALRLSALLGIDLHKISSHIEAIATITPLEKARRRLVAAQKRVRDLMAEEEK